MDGKRLAEPAKPGILAIQMTRVGDTMPLPEYDRPPVIEVVTGVQFDAIANWNVVNSGIYWQRIRNEYPNADETSLLADQIEHFGGERATESRVSLSVKPQMPRMWFVDQPGNWLIQVQASRFLHNWRTVSEDDEYPRYPEVSRRFFNAWNDFVNFCDESDLGPPQVNQLELSYINHVIAGEGWSNLAHVGDVFPDLLWRAGERYLPTPESIAWRSAFTLPEQVGRLHVSVRSGKRKSDDRPVLLCDLTARGMHSAQQSIAGWFDLAHQWIVRGFADLTDDNIQQAIWRRRV